MKSYLLLALVTLATTNLYSMLPAQAQAKKAQIDGIMASDASVAEKIAALNAVKAELPANDRPGLERFLHADISERIAELNPAAHPVAAHPGAAAVGHVLAFGAPVVIAHPPVWHDSDSEDMDTDSE